MKWSYVPYQAEATDEWKVAPGIARRFYEPRGTKVSDELVAEAERTKSTERRGVAWGVESSPPYSPTPTPPLSLRMVVKS